MLALDRPLGVVAGLALFGDHARENYVYYVPTRPRLARLAGVDELAFVKFRGSDSAARGGVGFLSFTTELAATEEQLEEVRDLLAEQGVSQPVLAQTPWIGGKAFLAAALEEGDGFVEKLLGETTPDLAGTNRATFSAMLGEDGARLIEALLDLEGPNPLGVRYELEYAGLRPALDVRLTADYKRVYEELSWGFELGVAYQGVGVRAGVESATQKLVENGAIQVEVLHFTDDADLHGRVDKAIQWFQDRILEEFFQSSLQPPAHENMLERAIEAAAALGAASLEDALADEGIAGQLASRLGLSTGALGILARSGGGGGGASGGAPAGGGQGQGSQSTFALKAQFTFRDIDQTELKTITLDWREARAEKRTAAPQGLLSRFGAPPRIVEAEDSGDFWERLKVNVRPLGDFEKLGVKRLIVNLAYPSEDDPKEQKAFTFESGEGEPQTFAAWTDDGPREYRTMTEVHFDEEGPWPGPPVFTSPWRPSQSLELGVHPLSEVPRIEIELAPGTVSFAETPQVQVDLRHGEEALATRMLNAESPTAVVRHRLKTSPSGSDASPAGETEAPPRLEARPTWFLARGGRATGEWSPVEGTAFLAHAPWRSRRTVRLFPLLPDDFIEAIVTLTMTEGGRSQTADVRFASGERRTRSVELPSLSEQPPPVRVDVLVIRGDGSTFVGEPYDTTDPVVLVTDREGRSRQIKVRLMAGPSLFDHGLMGVQVQLLDTDDEVVDDLVFTESSREPGLLLAPIDPDAGPGASAEVRYRVVRYSLGGVASAGEIETSTRTELLVPAVVAS